MRARKEFFLTDNSKIAMASLRYSYESLRSIDNRLLEICEVIFDDRISDFDVNSLICSLDEVNKSLEVVNSAFNFYSDIILKLLDKKGDVK